jgi:lipopolysaccharide transport system ATP-binding protein
MSDIAIKVENLSKKYLLGTSASGNLRDTLANSWNQLIGKTDKKNSQKEFWALKDVSFEVKKGEVIGIIGRNGAGKSTLLKILSRITEPTSGRVELNGRVASLLEVGTGFHPELSGRENIFLNGALLGMTRAEIKRKFDEIIDFSGVEEFIDTPVKKYSSGMYVRLAFAVAAHLEPEILLIDEVLAVGDAEFQKKCLGKMGEVARGGRTVIFVSHNMGLIENICSKTIILLNGEIQFNGDTTKATSIITSISNTWIKNTDLSFYRTNRGNNKVCFLRAHTFNPFNNKASQVFDCGESIGFTLELEKRLSVNSLMVAIEIVREDGLKIANIISKDSNFTINPIKKFMRLHILFKDLRLYPAKYYVNLWLGDSITHEIYDYLLECLEFQILTGGNLTSRHLPIDSGVNFYTPKWSNS